MSETCGRCTWLSRIFDMCLIHGMPVNENAERCEYFLLSDRCKKTKTAAAKNWLMEVEK